MSRPPLHTTPTRAGVRAGVEYEFERLTLPRQLPRSFVTRLLTERAEHGGWELDRLRIGNDGKRRVVLRRKIIRQARPTLYYS